MSREELIVTVTGLPNTGKTSVARIIEEALKENGFQNVSVKDQDPTPGKEGIVKRIQKTKKRKVRIEARKLDAQSLLTEVDQAISAGELCTCAGGLHIRSFGCL